MENAVKQTWFFDRSPEDVWEYLVRPELIEQWLGKCDIKAVTGHKFKFTSPDCGDTFCEVLKVAPYTHLSYSWQKNSAKDGKPFKSIVEWTLKPKADGTELLLVHSGFTSQEDTDDHRNGWNTCREQLHGVLNKMKHAKPNA